MRHVFFILLSIIISGCAANSNVSPKKTQLQIREFQTRSYETADVKMIMKAMINVLQDDGYIVKNVNLELGLLTATKEMDVESKGEAFMATLFMGAQARWKKNSIIESSANVSEFGSQCRVRVNFQLKSMDNAGGVLEVHQIEDGNYYQEFFSKVDKGVFIQKEKI